MLVSKVSFETKLLLHDIRFLLYRFLYIRILVIHGFVIIVIFSFKDNLLSLDFQKLQLKLSKIFDSDKLWNGDRHSRPNKKY